MNKKIILSLASAILLTSSLLFATDVNVSEQGAQPAKQSGKKMHKEHHGKNYFLATVMQLKLSDEQKAKIKDVMKENMKNMPKPNDAFTDKGFDKELFIKLSKQKEESKLENRANMIESVYNLLNDAQKKELNEKLQKNRVCMDKEPK
jgi:Spy/CpxP family protein refolding chaperone